MQNIFLYIINFYIAHSIAQQVSKYFKNEWYISSSDEIRNLKLTNITNDELQAAFVVHQNVPNPFNKSTIVQFELPENDEVLFEIKNINGQTFYSDKKWFNKGLNSITFIKDQQMRSGVYTYTLSTSKASQTYKMIVLE